MPVLGTTVGLNDSADSFLTYKKKIFTIFFILLECPDRRMQVLFLLDSSASLGLRNFRYALEFIADVSADFQRKSEHVRVALMTYATNSTVQFDFTQFQVRFAFWISVRIERKLCTLLLWFLKGHS